METNSDIYGIDGPDLIDDVISYLNSKGIKAERLVDTIKHDDLCWCKCDISIGK